MTRFALPACTFAAIALAGCTTYYDPPPTAPVTTTGGAAVTAPAASAVPTAPAAPVPAARTGIIESITLVSVPTSATAGGTLPAVTSGPFRVTLRMDDGTIQTMQVDDRAILVGDRVQIMPNGKLNRL
jgi:hypothetical protein